MIPRLFNSWKSNSFFLMGPRGTGKSTWLAQQFPQAVVVDLLEAKTYQSLSFDPSLIQKHYPIDRTTWMIIDEVQKIPELLDEVHRSIEKEGRKFVLTGSSARKLRKSGANLLAGRAYQSLAYPLTVAELGDQFNLERALQFGSLPKALFDPDPKAYLESYLTLYLREEILQEGIVRNIGPFSRFLRAASFSHGQILNTSEVSREAEVERKLVESYFEVLEDLLIGYRLPVFTKRAKRKMTSHPKFFFFDTGVFQFLRPKGPLDSAEYVAGSALEGLVFQDLLAMNHYRKWGYQFFTWRSHAKREVDLVLYGDKGVCGIEIKHSDRIREGDLLGLKEFK